jgi:ribonuclease D
MEKLKLHRDRVAAELQIDPTLIASRATLALLAQDFSRYENDLMNWQRELLKAN